MNILEHFRRQPLAAALFCLAVTFAVLAAIGGGNRMVFVLVAAANFFAGIVFFMKGRASDDQNKD
jgi:hypothetical protein